ncbi:hypothetical protein F4774DRAFT_366418 [Daldinia eschscholtzii]|nr:hypothetical protein F4774DRAFT_366418 [Daldinia eschscholtzii]
MLLSLIFGNNILEFPDSILFCQSIFIDFYALATLEFFLQILFFFFMFPMCRFVFFFFLISSIFCAIDESKYFHTFATISSPFFPAELNHLFGLV